MGEPWTLLTVEPAEEAIRQECGNTEFGGSLGFAAERSLCIERDVESVPSKMLDPLLMFIPVLGNEQLTVEPGEYALEGVQSPIVGAIGVSRIRGLIGVAEQHGVEAGAAGKQCDVVETAIERRAIRHDAMIHLVHPGVEAGSAGRARSALAVVASQTHTVAREVVDVRRLDDRMTSNREAVCAKLIQRDQQDIHDSRA